MNRNVLSGLVLVVACVGMGQTTAPATKPGLTASQAKWIADHKAVNAKRVADNPAFMAIVNKVPKNLIPTTANEGPAVVQRIKALRAWGIANLDGKPVKIRAFVASAQNAEFYLADNPLNQYEIHPMVDGGLSRFNTGDEVIIEGTAGKGGSLLIGVNKWKDGELFYNYHLLVLNAKVTKAASPATQQAPQK